MFREDNLKAIVQALDLAIENVQKNYPEEVEQLEKYKSARLYTNEYIDGNAIADVWVIDDIVERLRAEEEPPENATDEEYDKWADRPFTDDEIGIAKKTLKFLNDHSDASVGVNWDSIDSAIEYVKGNL